MKKEECKHFNRVTLREEKLKSNITKRLNRIEGQVRGVKGMIENNIYCDDILQQVSAIRAALDSINKLILENHIKTCVLDKIKKGDKEILDELMITIGRML